MKSSLKHLEVWFVTGSQHLYGSETLEQVNAHSEQIAEALDTSENIPVRVIFKPVVTTPDAILNLCLEANRHSNCIGLVCWMHTFSPAKMWIGGLRALQKPVCHLHTQFNRDIPWAQIDMDFMNLNQSAHGGREFGFMATRMRLNRKVIVGHWEALDIQTELNLWTRAAAGWHTWQGMKVARFGDNMREVAVTEGDKVEAQLKLGFSVNGFGIGDLGDRIKSVDTSAIKTLCKEYAESYTLVDNLKNEGTQRHALEYAARIEIALRSFLEEGNFEAFTDTFEDLHGLEQLPGLPVQRLMAEGYGFGAEGDWKHAALVRALKVMATGIDAGTSFMEDYTYHLDPANPACLGAHMLEICPSIAQAKPSCEIHPLGIGGKSDPVRLVFDGKAGSAINTSLVDMGNRFRLITQCVEAIPAQAPLPKLPVARVLWKIKPNLKDGVTAWILAGGAHHTAFSLTVNESMMDAFAEMAGIEHVVINEKTDLHTFKNTLRANEVYYGIKGIQ